MKNSKMTGLIVLVGSLVCASAQGIGPTDSQLPCGTSILNGADIQKRCSQKDYIAPKITCHEPGPIAKFFATVVSGGHGYLAGSTCSDGFWGWGADYINTELDMQGHIWDFSKQYFPMVALTGHDSVIKNGVIWLGNVSIGFTYYPPNFATGRQKNNLSVKEMGFLYADNYFDCKRGAYDASTCKGQEKKIENMFLDQMKFSSYSSSFNSWGGGIHNSQIVIQKKLNVDGSKATILNNQVWANAELENDKQLFALQATNQSKLIDKSSQIFPDRTDDNTAIPSVLYVKFSPDTVIDGNTFTLTHKNDPAYAIVLDHSLRVRITNNTFNGFKVPILMDQWSSIVDDKGNVLNPDQFSGDVEMNKMGEVVLRH